MKLGKKEINEFNQEEGGKLFKGLTCDAQPLLLGQLSVQKSLGEGVLRENTLARGEATCNIRKRRILLML